MQLRIKATKIELTPDIKAYIQEKMDKLEKYLGGIQVINCDVEVALSVGNQNNGKIYSAVVNMEVPHKMLVVKKTEKDLMKAIDKVEDHMERSIKRYKEKFIDKKRKEAVKTAL